MGYVSNVSEVALPEDDFEISDRIRKLQTKVNELIKAAGVAPIAEIPEDGVRPILELRARRCRFFGDALFGEPAWEMLLELYDAKSRGRRESVSSLCFASGVPQTTALRWVSRLECDGWLTRSPDPKDARRFFVEATDKTITAMNQLFRSCEHLPIVPYLA